MHAYEIVLKHIEAGILDHSLQPGVQLPTERDLAGQLGVGRSAVREAMRVLQTQGLITSSTGPGRGTRIAPAQGDALARIFRLHLTLAESGISDLTETRVALERASTSVAAGRASAKAAARLQSLVDQMANAGDIDTFNDLDTQFHVRIARAGQNQLIADLTVAIRQTVREPIHDASLAMSDWQDFRLDLIAEHQGIRDAIAAADPLTAANLMETHIRRAYARLGM